MKDRTRVLLVDTSLGDSGFGVAAALSANEKLELAAQLARLGVDGIVAGFPMGSPGDFAAVQALAGLAARWEEGPVLMALARPLAADVDACVRALGPVRRARIGIVCPPPANQAVDQVEASPRGDDGDPWDPLPAIIVRARSRFEVQVSVQDVLRWPDEELYELIRRVVDAGASFCVLVDSTGYGLPEEIDSAVRIAVRAASGRAMIGIHPHDDLGLATANALAAVQAGAGLVEGTMMGVGERAGNAALEEVAMTLRARGAKLPFETGIRPAAIYHTARLVSSLAGGVPTASKAIVGETALPATRGLAFVSGMVAGRPVEVLEAATIGRPAAGASLPGGLAAPDLARRLALLGVDVQPDQLDAVHSAYRELAARKAAVTVEDVEALISGLPAGVPAHYELAGFHIATGTSVPPAATVRLRTSPGMVREASAEGDGPVDAMYRAVDRLTGIPVTLLDYSLNAATSGRDALGQVAVKLLYKGQVFTGRGVSTDVLGASLRAYLHALNKVALARGRSNDFSASPH